MAVCTIITSIKVVTCVSSQQRQQHRRGDTSHSEGSETPRTGFAAPGLFPRWLSGYQPPTLGSSSASFGRSDELELGLLPENQAPLLTAPWWNIWWPPQISADCSLKRNLVTTSNISDICRFLSEEIFDDHLSEAAHLLAGALLEGIKAPRPSISRMLFLILGNLIYSNVFF